MFWVTVFISPVQDEGRDVVQHFASFLDITSHKEEEDSLRLELDELVHRAQNTLATVREIAEQTFRGVVDADMMDVFVKRIANLGDADARLRSETWQR